MSVIDRVASAICEADCGCISENEMARCHQLAKAAVGAMREPTETMRQAGWGRTHPDSGDPLPQHDEVEGEGWLPGIYRAMIDAALTEDKESA